jgi:N-formylglutamate deformylase
MPHAGTYLPIRIAERMTGQARHVPDTDWHVERLYDMAAGLGATVLTATHSRYVVDLNRPPDNRPLYPGASNTELCPLTMFDFSPIYLPGQEPDDAEVAARIEAYWRPYHDQLYRELARMQVQHGVAVLLDVHSIPSRAPRFFPGRLPDLNLGTVDGTSAARELVERAWGVCRDADGFSAVLDGRFKGGYITRRYGQPDRNVHALQIEIVQAAYMREGQPWAWEPAKAEPLRQVLGRMIGTLADWVSRAAAA